MAKIRALERVSHHQILASVHTVSYNTSGSLLCASARTPWVRFETSLEGAASGRYQSAAGNSTRLVVSTSPNRKCRFSFWLSLLQLWHFLVRICSMCFLCLRGCVCSKSGSVLAFSPMHVRVAGCKCCQLQSLNYLVCSNVASPLPSVYMPLWYLQSHSATVVESIDPLRGQMTTRNT